MRWLHPDSRFPDLFRSRAALCSLAAALALLLASGCAAWTAVEHPADSDPAFARCPVGTAAVVERIAAVFDPERPGTSRVALLVSPRLDPAPEIEAFIRRVDLLGGGTRSFTLVGQRADLVVELPAGAALEPLLAPARLGIHEVDEVATGALAEGADPDDLSPRGLLVVEAQVPSGTETLLEQLALLPATLGPDAIAACGARVIDGPGGPHLELTLTPAATPVFGELTARVVGRRIAITLDERLLTAPVVMEPIPGGKVALTFGQSGAGSARTWQTLATHAALFNAPALQAPLVLLERAAIESPR